MATETQKTNYYISSLLRKIQSPSASSVQKALISLSRATRKSDNVVKVREEGGISLLLEFVKSSNRKALDMAVSVLANCALEKQSREEVSNNYNLKYAWCQYSIGGKMYILKFFVYVCLFTK